MFQEFRSGSNVVCVTDELEEQIRGLDKKSRKRVLQYLYRLADRFPNKPEQWQKLKGSDCEDVFELKPKPYRVACLVYKRRYILAYYLWRVQSNRSKGKSDEIGKACRMAQEVKDGFKRFVERIQV